MASDAEREIRETVIAWVREKLPEARIIHELNVNGSGGCRADLAAVEKDFITLFEIKSERDTLKRIRAQALSFTRAAHDLVIVAHEKHFKGNTSHLDCDIGIFKRIETWKFPESNMERWRSQRLARSPKIYQPQAASMLEILWRSELIAEANTFSVPLKKRPTRHEIITNMAWLMNGRDVCTAVCRQLRERPFNEADPPCGETEHYGLKEPPKETKKLEADLFS